MITRILLVVLIGGAIGAVVGYFGKCSSGVCPLTANPYRDAIYGVVVGVLLSSVLSTKSAGLGCKTAVVEQLHLDFYDIS